MSRTFDFHPQARAEFAADVDWYDDRELGLGVQFTDAVRAAIEAAVVAASSAGFPQKGLGGSGRPPGV